MPLTGEYGDILETIRLMESGERYDIGPNRGNASGAYQYIASTWNHYAGYPHAYLAPPVIQDERALADVISILEDWDGDVSMVPVIWYYPVAARTPELMDIVPLPKAGNVLTVREYQHRWLEMLAFVTGGEYVSEVGRVPAELRFLSGRPPEIAEPDEELAEISFPLLGRTVVAPPTACTGDDCEPGSSAIVYGTAKLQPVLAAVAGIVTAVQPGNPIDGTVAVTVTDPDGRSYQYSGFNDDTVATDDGAAPPTLRFTALAEVGSEVRAGQILGYLGDTDPMPVDDDRGTTDRTARPHLRLTIRDADGVRLDADALVTAAQERQACHVAIGPWSVPSDPRLTGLDRLRDEALPAEDAHAARQGDIEVTPRDDGGWTLHADGTVTAWGTASLILSPRGCDWAPDEPFGPGARGVEAPPGWDDPIELPARFWVSGSLAGAGLGAAGLFLLG